eukprot:3854077-Prymnesium_polylepis.1
MQAHGSAARSCESDLTLPSRRCVRTRSRGQANAPPARWVRRLDDDVRRGMPIAVPARRVRRISRCRRCG